MFEYDRHYRECQRLNKPFIKARIHPKTGNYFVQIDLITCTYRLSEQDKEILKKLARQKIKFVKPSPNLEFENFSINEEIAWFDGILPEYVNEFCESLYDLTQENQD
ncbi:MAG: hypothetical protein ACR2LL_13300 [Nitrosopumilus sp.]